MRTNLTRRGYFDEMVGMCHATASSALKSEVVRARPHANKTQCTYNPVITGTGISDHIITSGVSEAESRGIFELRSSFTTAAT